MVLKNVFCLTFALLWMHTFTGFRFLDLFLFILVFIELNMGFIFCVSFFAWFRFLPFCVDKEKVIHMSLQAFANCLIVAFIINQSTNHPINQSINIGKTEELRSL